MRCTKRASSTMIGTIMASATSAKRQLRLNSSTVVPRSVTTAETIWITPLAAKPRICSTSLVTRVSNWPVATLS